MRKIPGVGFIIFIVASLLATQLFSHQVTTARVTQNFSPTACPASANGGVVTAALPSKKVQIHDVFASKKVLKYRSAGAISHQVGKSPLLVAGNNGTTFAIQTKSSTWTGATMCTAGISDSWFVGGSADITSQSYLSLVNSGLSDAVIDITAYSEKGLIAKLSYTVKQSSQKDIRLDSIAPGSSALALHLITRTGRITSYLFDERKKGLRTYGGDYVNTQSFSSPTLFIAGIPTSLSTTQQTQSTSSTSTAKKKKKSKTSSINVKHILRIMNAGDIKTTATVQVSNSQSVITPIGLNAINLAPGVVREIALDGDLGMGSFGVKISADQNLVASVYTYFESQSFREFLWSTPSQSADELASGPITLNLGGLEPTLTLVSDNIDVVISWTNTKGKVSSKTFHESDFLLWQVPANTRQLVITRTPRGASLSGGALTWRGASGIAFLPLKSGSILDTAAKPISNAATIS